MNALIAKLPAGLRPETARGTLEREFLPAALEIIDSPPSPAGRATAGALCAFFVVALGWSILGHVDIIATAEGRLVPVGKVKLVQPLEAGVVRAIHVQDGDRVKAGQLLVELDPTATGADRDRIARDLLDAELDVARLGALKQGLDRGQIPPLAAPAGASPRDLEMTEAALTAQAAEQTAKLASLDQQIAQKRAEAEEVAAEIRKLDATLPVLAQKEALRKQLLDVQYGNRFAYLDAQQQLLEGQHQRDVMEHRTVEIEAARSALERQREQTRAEYTRQLLSDLAEAEQQESEQRQELVKATRKAAETSLMAPIDGVVQQLAIHTVGGVVTPAQALMVVVPDETGLVVEAMLPNRDVGFVHAGQPVEVKVETFTFTRYGLLHGTVVDVSRDAVTDDQRQPDRPREGQGAAAGGKDKAATPASVARVRLDRSSTSW